MIGFNKPYLTGKELDYIRQAIEQQVISGNGYFTHQCQEFFRLRYGFQHTLLTTSCTSALEMSALLIDLRAGDEIILPSFTFVSTANAFVLRGASLVFADSSATHPNLDAHQLESLITPRTKAIIVVHYAGIACDMAQVMALANQYGLYVIEDAAQAIDTYYQGKPVGSFGHLACFSFHETKNIMAGEGGLLVINEEKFVHRAEIIWQKGTNRSAFFRGEVDRYTWVDVGSSFCTSDMIAAFLFAQLENLDAIQAKRTAIWNHYYRGLFDLQCAGLVLLPQVPAYSTNNAHIFYLVCGDLKQRTDLIDFLKEHCVQAVFHYISLHQSPYYRDKHLGAELPNTDRYSDCLVRLPLYYEMSEDDIERIISLVKIFFNVTSFPIPSEKAIIQGN